MQRFLCMILVVFALGCGPEKKTAETNPEKSYDYRAALQNFNIGTNYLQNNEILRAIQHLEQAAEGDPNNYRYRHALGLAYSLNGQLEKAEEALNSAVSINPKDSESYNLLGSIYTDLGRYEEATAALRKVILDASYSQPHFPFFNLGKCMAKQGRIPEAIAAYERSVSLKPDFYRAYVALAQIHQENKDFEKALTYLKKAEPGFNNNVELLYGIGQALFNLHRLEEAKSYLAQVSILFPPPAIDGPTQKMLRYIENAQREKHQ